MTFNGWAQIALYFVVLTALVVPLGRFMARVFEGEWTFLSPVFRPVEAVLYRAAGVDERREQHWLTYTVAMLLFNAAGFLLVYALQRFQAVLPLNPAGMSAVAPDLSFNTAVSFTTNTNWQNYGGESTMSYLTQMAALTTQNFVSAATGIALAIALIRAFARASAKTVGNFWVDLTRCTLYVLLPLSFVGALFLVWQGVPQNVGPYVDATTLEGATQTISQGPAASQIAIKQLGTNGGGFWNANSSVPYENPTPLSNFVEVLYILLISAALTHTFGRMVKDERQGWALYAAMSILFLAGVLVTYWAEGAGNPNFAALGLDPANMEGKEVRFGIANSSLWAVATTDASNGSVNAMHDSFTPLGGMIPIINMELGEIIYRRRRLGSLWHAAHGHRCRVRRRADGRPHAGIPRQEDRGEGGQNGDARHSDPAAVDARLHGGGRAVALRPVQHPGPRPARLQRGAVPVHVADRQQRLRLRRLHRQHALVQHDRRPCHADRALFRHHPDDGGGRLAGREEDGAGLRRNLPNDREPLCWPARRRDPHHRRPRSISRRSRSGRSSSISRCKRTRCSDHTHPDWLQWQLPPCASACPYRL